MNARNKSVLETLIRVKGFSTQTGLTINVRATSLFTQVDALISAMEAAGTDQVSGLGNARIGTERKRELAGEVRGIVRQINRTVKGLDDDTHPNAAAQFPMPRSRTYQALLATARAFLEAIAPIKADLIASGMPADFDETLQGLVADFTVATQAREGGLDKQVGGTAGLAANEKSAVRLLEKLDVTMSNVLVNDPSLLGSWKRTVRIPRATRGGSAEGGPGPSVTVSAPQQSTPSLPAGAGAGAAPVSK
jgi:hypothetical protein